MKTFGKYAKERIRQLGKSQKDLAERLGVSRAYISQILSGKKNPPDLGKPKNRPQLLIWSEFFAVPEDHVLGLVRFELHRVPPKPSPRYPGLRRLLIERLRFSDKVLLDEIQALELHPAENQALHQMVRIFFILQEHQETGSAYGPARFKDFCFRAKSNKDFIESELLTFFRDTRFSWIWDREANEVTFYSEVDYMQSAVSRLQELFSDSPNMHLTRTIPVVGHVSAGEGFEFTDGGYAPGEGFDQVELPPGVDPCLAPTLYCVRVRGDSLREFFGDGTLLFIKPQSWEQIKDGDLVIFKDKNGNKAFVKKVEFSGDNLILKSMNPLYKHMVLSRSDIVLLERVMSILL
jgi:phage repressor protein C with HTH and peptisase S24 domain/transcriptional regulator with XRE-family HTH domain